jgi:hypothetical protein
MMKDERHVSRGGQNVVRRQYSMVNTLKRRRRIAVFVLGPEMLVLDALLVGLGYSRF